MSEDMELRVSIANGPEPEVWSRRGAIYPLHKDDEITVGDFAFMVKGSLYDVKMPPDSTVPGAEVVVEAVYHANAMTEPKLDELREQLVATGFTREDGEV